MNNHGSLSLKNSSEISREFKYPINATANSTINIKEGNLNLQNNIIITEATASNPSVAAARATAKAASLATSTIANDKNYLSDYDPFENSVTFQISTMCTVQRAKSSDPKFSNSSISNYHHSPIKTDTVKSLNDKMHSNEEIENIHVFIKPQSNKGTKFEKLRRELESLDQARSTPSKFELNNEIENTDKYSRLSDNSGYSNASTLSSCPSDQPLFDSTLHDTLNYFSDSSSVVSNENRTNKFNLQRNQFLSGDNESDNSSSNKKFKISDLKRHSKLYNFNSSDIFSKNLKEYKHSSNESNDVNSVHYIRTVPGTSCIKSLTINHDIGELVSNSSLLPETDLDSGTLSENYFFRQTDFYKDQPNYSFEKTRSLVDLRKPTETDYQTGISKTLSIEELKKFKPVEESDLIKRLKSKAQSTQELRIADSLTKLNVPQWMNDFKLSSTRRNDLNSNKVIPGPSVLSFKTLKHHDNILSKYKYNSLPIAKPISEKKDQYQNNKVLLPSSLYRSRSQNLIFFNPDKDSKLKNLDQENNAHENRNSSLKLLNDQDYKYRFDNRKIITTNINLETKNRLSDLSYQNSNVGLTREASHGHTYKTDEIINLDKRESDNKRILTRDINLETKNRLSDLSYQNSNVGLTRDANHGHTSNTDEIIKLDKKESEFILSTLIYAVQNQSLFDERLCESFGINPSALKLLLNVKRKTPNLNRDETTITSKLNENVYIENARTVSNGKNYVICNFNSCGKEILQANKVDRHMCSCYNCFTYYCSKKCRNNDFSYHLLRCSFNRINKMFLKLKNGFSETQLESILKFAKENHRKYGEGTVLIAYESCRSADDFLNGVSNRLLSVPYYFSDREMKKNIPVFKLPEYDSTKECLVTLFICATLPMTSIESSYPTFRYSFKLKYKTNLEQTVVHGNTSHQNENNDIKEFEIRKDYFNYIINFFKAKNVILSQSHPIIYSKLEKYLNDKIEFESLTVFVKDPLLNSTVAYMISPNKEVVSKIIRNVSNISTSSVSSMTKNNLNKSITETEI